MIPFDAPDTNDRGRFALFGRVLRRAQFLAIADPSRDPLLVAPLLIVLGDDFPEGAVFFCLSDKGRSAPAPSEPPKHGRA